MEKILFSLIVGLLISGCSSDQNNDTEERVTANIEKHANGLAYEYNQKKPFTGIFVGFDHNGGKKAEIHFKNGKQNGTAKMWYENGQQSHEIYFYDGKLEGLATDWNQDGSEYKNSIFQNGKLTGSME